jgi:hypothetical protein
MTAETFTTVRELNSRVSNGIQVRLLWRELDDSVWVVVVDTRSGHRFRVEVAADERPRDVFEHPFAYAATRGVETQPTRNPVGPVSGDRQRA